MVEKVEQVIKKWQAQSGGWTIDDLAAVTNVSRKVLEEVLASQSKRMPSRHRGLDALLSRKERVAPDLPSSSDPTGH